jgi:hypothetical protein
MMQIPGFPHILPSEISLIPPVIPMHLTIIFGSIVVFALQNFGIQSTMPVLVFFLVLKTYSDLSAHLAKHYQEEHPDKPVWYL